MQYLARWKGFGPDEDTWEPWENIEDGAIETMQDFHRNNPGQERDPRVKVQVETKKMEC